ncbi:MAG: NAD(P)H-dependent oxidoreductase [Eubacteriales bacterium]|nr:NAD(P)H-dependent oxidoreductase [Eubacteriales bacterium]
MKLLLINACARKESRSKKLAEKLTDKWDGELETLNLYEENLPVLDEVNIEKRGEAVENNDMNNPYMKYAVQFRDADVIVMAAPFWDMGFPAILKTYIETIMLTGITFSYSPEGYPMGLCHAKKLIYVTTAGGPILPQEFGYSYIHMLATQMWGIKDCHCIKAEGLDIIGADVDTILSKAEEEIADFTF